MLPLLVVVVLLLLHQSSSRASFLVPLPLRLRHAAAGVPVAAAVGAAAAAGCSSGGAAARAGVQRRRAAAVCLLLQRRPAASSCAHCREGGSMQSAAIRSTKLWVGACVYEAAIANFSASHPSSATLKKSDLAPRAIFAPSNRSRTLHNQQDRKASILNKNTKFYLSTPPGHLVEGPRKAHTVNKSGVCLERVESMLLQQRLSAGSARARGLAGFHAGASAAREFGQWHMRHSRERRPQSETRPLEKTCSLLGLTQHLLLDLHLLVLGRAHHDPPYVAH